MALRGNLSPSGMKRCATFLVVAVYNVTPRLVVQRREWALRMHQGNDIGLQPKMDKAFRTQMYVPIGGF
jgi:hypothetical protein